MDHVAALVGRTGRLAGSAGETYVGWPGAFVYSGSYACEFSDSSQDLNHPGLRLSKRDRLMNQQSAGKGDFSLYSLTSRTSEL